MVIAENKSPQKPRRSEQSLHLPPANPADFIFSKRPFFNTLPSPESPEFTPFELKRRDYMVNFLKPYSASWEAWNRGGLLIPDAHNIIEHHVVAAIIGRSLAKAIGLLPQEIEDVTLALLVHDADKLIEMKKLSDAAQKSKGSARRQTVAPVLLYGHQMLEGIVPPHIQELSAANVPDRLSVHPDMLHQIVHYIDAILDGSRLVNAAPRMQAGISKDGGRLPILAKIRYQTHEKHLGIGPGEYIKLQTRLAQEEAANFVQMMKEQNPALQDLTANHLHEYLQRLFEQEVEAFAA